MGLNKLPRLPFVGTYGRRVLLDLPRVVPARTRVVRAKFRGRRHPVLLSIRKPASSQVDDAGDRALPLNAVRH